MPELEIQYHPNFILLINHLPHVAIAGELQGFKSYIDGFQGKEKYFIEFFSQAGGLTCEYEERELWEKILLTLKQKFYGKIDH